jgi:hypothetical protein
VSGQNQYDQADPLTSQATQDSGKVRTCKDLPIATCPYPLPARDVCHFVCPVRFGRRRADQYGYLVLTSGRLRFRGALDMSVAWSEVASVDRADAELIVRLQESTRLLRFSCQSGDDAARGGEIASVLVRAARESDTSSDAPSYHASV